MRRRTLAVLLLVLLAVAAAYRPVLDNGFIDLDDVDYILQNPNIAAGLTPGGVAWAFTATKPWNWHPLTWVSHMADVSLFGLDPRGHHATSLLLHLANVSLAFLALRGLTGWLWRSAGAAALLGLHPVHVEAVAWASERKGMLSSFFFLLALCTWLRYVRRPGPRRYLAVMLALAASLMSKQMAVTLPVLLLALDFWPLGRLGATAPGGPRGPLPSAPGLRRAALEKLPLLLLAAGAVLVAVLTQASGGAVMTLAEFTLPQRLGNALLSYWAYLGSLLRPTRLAVFYVHPQASISWAAVAAAGTALVAALALALAQARRRPWLLACTLWYLVSLVPVLGILQLGWHARADRYVYLPFILVYLGGLTAAAALVRGLPRRRLAAGLAAAAVLAALGALTWRQAGYWRGDIPLFEHAIAVTGENWFAESNLGAAWIKRGRMDLGIPHWRAAVRLNRDFAIIKPRR